MALPHNKGMHIGIINGPNLHNIGSREVDIYGVRTMTTCLEDLQRAYPDWDISYYQSHYEGDIIEALYRLDAVPGIAGIVLNAGAYTHTSIAILDAIRAITTPVVEVHLSNIFAREEFRHRSIISGACRGLISGFGLDSYKLAVEAIVQEYNNK